MTTLHPRPPPLRISWSAAARRGGRAAAGLGHAPGRPLGPRVQPRPQRPVVLRVLRERRAGAKASLLPRRFGVDGIILFYDITTLPVAMGQPFVLQPRAGPVPDHPIRTLADVDRLETQPEPRALSAHPRSAASGARGAARRAAGAGLRRGAVHRGDVLHRHRQGHGRHAPLRRRAAARLGRPARPADDGDHPLPAHADRRRGRRVSTLRFVGRDAGARGVRDVGAAPSPGDLPRGDRRAAHPVRQGRARICR